MLLFDAPLTFREVMTHEEIPLAAVFREVFQFLATRPDAALFGAQAVNAYCERERMTQDVDVLSTAALSLAEALRAHLADRFHIAARVREVVPGVGYRVYQARKPKNRHLVDIRAVANLPACRVFENVQVVAPLELCAMKAHSMAERKGVDKGLSDRLDLHRLLLSFPELKHPEGAVLARLREMAVPERTLALWREVAEEPIALSDDDSY